MSATACTEHDTTEPTDATTMEQPSDYLRKLDPTRRPYSANREALEAERAFLQAARQSDAATSAIPRPDVTRASAEPDPEAHLNDAGSSDDGDEFRLPPAWAKIHPPRPRTDEWDPDTLRSLATSVDPDTAAFDRRHGILILGAAELLIMMAEPIMRGSDTWDLALAQYRALQEL
jgi:hypothetical protein